MISGSSSTARTHLTITSAQFYIADISTRRCGERPVHQPADAQRRRAPPACPRHQRISAITSTASGHRHNAITTSAHRASRRSIAIAIRRHCTQARRRRGLVCMIATLARGDVQRHCAAARCGVCSVCARPCVRSTFPARERVSAGGDGGIARGCPCSSGVDGATAKACSTRPGHRGDGGLFVARHWPSGRARPPGAQSRSPPAGTTPIASGCWRTWPRWKK